MNKYLLLAGLLFLIAFPSISDAHLTGKGHVHDISALRQNFLNLNCVKDNTCSLKRFSLFTRKYEVWLADDLKPTLGTESIAEYETDTVDNIEKFVIVQFIKGCPFVTEKDSTGNIKKYLIHDLKKFFGEEYVPFCFSDWVIDSVDKDPVYNSDPDYGRHWLYRWNKIDGSYENGTEMYYGEQKPALPKLYVTDSRLPGAFVAQSGALNVSLQFRTCIYKASSVPESTDPGNINFAVPINCFEWKSSYIYNWELGKFESKDSIDPFCLEYKKEPTT